MSTFLKACSVQKACSRYVRNSHRSKGIFQNDKILCYKVLCAEEKSLCAKKSFPLSQKVIPY